MRVMRDARAGICFDGIELINPSIAGKVVAAKVERFNRESGHLPETGGSDAHTLPLIGSAYTTFAGTTADDFRRSLRAKQTQAGGGYWGREDYLALARIARRQMFKSLVRLPVKHIRRSIQLRRTHKTPLV